MAQASVPKKLVLSSFTRNRHKAEEWLNESGHGLTDGIVAKRLEDPYKPARGR
jgi:ATP-dependent DNA ligase